jgi:hypothetical protein
MEDDDEPNHNWCMVCQGTEIKRMYLCCERPLSRYQQEKIWSKPRLQRVGGLDDLEEFDKYT